MKSFSESQLNEIFEPMRSMEPSNDLTQSISAITSNAPAKRDRHRLAWFAAAACAALAVAASVLLPGRAAAATLIERMARAIEAAQTVHLVTYNHLDGRWVAESETWYANGNWRILDNGDLQIYGSDKKWFCGKGQTVALASPRAYHEKPIGMGGGFGLTSSFEELRRRGIHVTVEYGHKRLQGKEQVVPVTVTQPGHSSERDVFLVEASTDLPLEITREVLTSHGWRSVSWTLCEYNIHISPQVFGPTFPRPVKIVNYSTLCQSWRQILRKPTVKASVGANHVVINNVFMNSRGWVFLLWTGEIGGRDYRLFLHDEEGREYVRALFNPGIAPPAGSQQQLLFLDGNVVDGAWFVPLNPVEHTRPHRFTLKVVSMQFPKIKEHMAQVEGWWGNRPFDGPIQLLGGIHVNPVRRLQGEIMIPRVEPRTAFLPGYMSLFHDGPKTLRQGHYFALLARKQYWMLRLNKEPRRDMPTQSLVPPLSEDGRFLSAAVQLVPPGTSLSDNCSIEALKHLQDVEVQLISTDRESGFEWHELGEVDRALGDDEAANKAFALARQLDPRLSNESVSHE